VINTPALSVVGVPGQINGGRAKVAQQDPVDAVIHQEISGSPGGRAKVDPKQQQGETVLIENLVQALNRQVRARPHPVLYVTSGLLFTVVLALVQVAYQAGSLSNRVAVLEGKTTGVETLQTKIDALQQDFRRFVERYERREDMVGVGVGSKR